MKTKCNTWSYTRRKKKCHDEGHAVTDKTRVGTVDYNIVTMLNV